MQAKQSILQQHPAYELEQKSKIIVDLSSSIQPNQRQIKQMTRPPIAEKNTTFTPKKPRKFKNDAK